MMYYSTPKLIVMYYKKTLVQWAMHNALCNALAQWACIWQMQPQQMWIFENHQYEKPYTDDLTLSLLSLRNGYHHQPMMCKNFLFSPSTIKLWNQLTAVLINSSTPNDFFMTTPACAFQSFEYCTVTNKYWDSWS